MSDLNSFRMEKMILMRYVAEGRYVDHDFHNDWDQSLNDTREGIMILHTDGTSIWAHNAIPKEVRVTEMRLINISCDERDANFCVFFNTDDWRVDKDGLIYTDQLFMTELAENLSKIGLDSSDIEYSTHKNQGDNFVFFKVHDSFIKSYKEHFPEEYAAIHQESNRKKMSNELVLEDRD